MNKISYIRIDGKKISVADFIARNLRDIVFYTLKSCKNIKKIKMNFKKNLIYYSRTLSFYKVAMPL